MFRKIANYYKFMLRREMQLAKECNLYVDDGKQLIFEAMNAPKDLLKLARKS